MTVVVVVDGETDVVVDVHEVDDWVDEDTVVVVDGETVVVVDVVDVDDVVDSGTVVVVDGKTVVVVDVVDVDDVVDSGTVVVDRTAVVDDTLVVAGTVADEADVSAPRMPPHAADISAVHNMRVATRYGLVIIIVSLRRSVSWDAPGATQLVGGHVLIRPSLTSIRS